MSKRKDGKPRGQYTTEFKLEAVRLVKGGQSASVTAKVLGMPKQTLDNWVRRSEKGVLVGADDKPVSAEQMELARLRAELARVKMECDILLIFPKYMTTIKYLKRYISRVNAGEYCHGTKTVERSGKDAIASGANAAGRQGLRRSSPCRGRSTANRVHMEAAAG